MKKAFTLVELLVVIGIIAVLSGVLLTSLSGGTDSARAAICLSNMRNLAAACQSYGAEHGRYPHAGSIEYMYIDESSGISRAKGVYKEIPGWISWNSQGAYRNTVNSHQASGSWMLSMYSQDETATRYCMTNGALWKYVSGGGQTYVCPSHAIKMKNPAPNWSYLMNAYFGWDKSQGGKAEGKHFSRIDYGHLKRADKILLFGEVPFAGLTGTGNWTPDGGGSGTDCDCVLQFNVNITSKTATFGCAKGGSGQEQIGFNHKSGKMTFANVVFADGHTEKLRLPKGGMSDSALRDLTAWLCTGTEISFDGSSYQKMEN